MSTEELRRELARIGDSAPVAQVPADTFSRARRARRRDRALTVGAAVAVVALVAGLATWLPQRSEPEPAGTGEIGVPDVIHAVPAGALKATADLAVGRAAVALTSADGLPVVIDAEDGTYRALDLPGFGSSLQTVLALSPDGWRLAWTWAGDPGTAGKPTDSGVRVLDLMTGRQRSIRLAGGQGVLVDQLLWSRDSRWLLWHGADSTQWSDSAFSTGPPSAGRIGPGSTTSQSVPAPHNESTTYAIGDDGIVVIATDRQVLRWDGRVLDRQRQVHAWYPVAVTADRGTLLETISRTPDADTFISRFRLVSPDGTRTPAPALDDVQVTVLGWRDDHTVVGLVDSLGAVGRHLALLDLAGEPSLRPVGTVSALSPSVAVDLMSADRATVQRPEPAWAHPDEGWSDAQISIAIGLGVAAVLALLEAGRWWWRRRRSAATP